MNDHMDKLLYQMWHINKLASSHVKRGRGCLKDGTIDYVNEIIHNLENKKTEAEDILQQLIIQELYLKYYGNDVIVQKLQL